MATGVYTACMTEALKGNINATSDTIKAALMDNSHAFDVDDDTWSDVSANEVTGTGYTAGGATLASVAVTSDDTANLTKLDATDPSWATSTIDAYHCVINNVTASNTLMISYDFGGIKSSVAGTFTVQFGAGGMATFANV